MTYKIKLEVRKETPMSDDGHDRLSKKVKNWFRRVVYPPVLRKTVRTSLIDCEENLAKWLYLNVGNGVFLVHSWKKDAKTGRRHYTKALCQVEIIVKRDGSFSYEFEHIRGFARYKWWVLEI